jgi:ferrous iron transport protein A
MSEQKKLIQLKTGESARVVSVVGGMQFQRKLESLGIRAGSKLTKISSHFWRGPITVRVNQSSVAIGYGMASKILVETE